MLDGQEDGFEDNKVVDSVQDSDVGGGVTTTENVSPNKRKMRIEDSDEASTSTSTPAAAAVTTTATTTTSNHLDNDEPTVQQAASIETPSGEVGTRVEGGQGIVIAKDEQGRMDLDNNSIQPPTVA